MIISPQQLPELLALVHDYWFNVEQIVLDRAERTVRIRLEPNRSDLEKTSSRGVELEFKNVDDLLIEDTQKVRDYDLNTIHYDPSRKQIILTGGIPIKVILRVDSLGIDLHKCGEKGEGN